MCIVETVDVNPTDEAYIESLGFEKLDNEMRLRAEAPVARRDLLGRVMTDGAVLAETLGEIKATLPPGLAVGALAPLLPWFFVGGHGAAMATVVLTVIAALAVGAGLSTFTGRSVVRSALRQLVFVAVPAAFVYGIGALVGVATG